MTSARQLEELGHWIPEARTLGLDVGGYGREIGDAFHFLRNGEPRQAESLIQAIHEKLGGELHRALQARLLQLDRRVDRLSAFGLEPPGTSARNEVESALQQGRFGAARETLAKWTEEVRKGEEKLGDVGHLLEEVDLLLESVKELGGSPAREAALLDLALQGARRGDRDRAEERLRQVVHDLSEDLLPLMARRLTEYNEQLREQRQQGRDIRNAAEILKEVAVALRTHQAIHASRLFPRLEEEVRRGRPARPPPAPPTAPEPTRTRIKGRSRITVVGAEGTASPGLAASSTPSPGNLVSGGAPSAAPPPLTPAPVSRSEPPVVRGRSYLVLESRPRRAPTLFRDLGGKPGGLFLTTVFPPRLRDSGGLTDVSLVWLSEAGGWEDTLNPKTLEYEVAARVDRQLKSDHPGALGIDGISYLVSVNGLEKVEKFLKTTLDIAASRDVSIVATLAPGALEAKAQARLQALFDHVVEPNE